MSVNKQILVGRLGRDPEIKYVGESALCKFSLATSEKWKSKTGEQKEDTQWHNIEAWGRLAELAGQYLSKGREVYVEGTTVHETYTGKDGAEKRRTKVKVRELKFIGSKSDSQGQNNSAQQSQQPGGSSDGLPF